MDASQSMPSLQAYNGILHYFTLFYIILQSNVFHPSLDWVENFPLPTWWPNIFPDKLLIKSVRFYKAKFYRVFAFSQFSYKAGLPSRKIMQKSKPSFNLFQFLKIEIFLALYSLNRFKYEVSQTCLSWFEFWPGLFCRQIGDLFRHTK